MFNNQQQIYKPDISASIEKQDSSSEQPQEGNPQTNNNSEQLQLKNNLGQACIDNSENPQVNLINKSQQQQCSAKRVEFQNVKQKLENKNRKNLQPLSQLNKKASGSVSQIWEWDQEDFQPQEQQVFNMEEVKSNQDQNSDDQQQVQDQYPQDYDAEEDTYFEKSIIKLNQNQKNEYDQELSEWPLPMRSITCLHQKQDQQKSVSWQTPKIQIDKIMNTQEYIDFINKNYLRKLYFQDEEPSNENITHKMNKRVLFKNNILIKRYRQNDEVIVIAQSIEQSQCLNMNQQKHILAAQNQTQNNLELNKKVRKDNIAITNQKSDQLKVKWKQEKKKQNDENEDYKQNFKDEKQFDEDDFIEIWSSLEGRSIRLIK